MNKKLAIWLSEHAVVLGSGGKDSVMHLWCIEISFVLTMLFALMGWTGVEIEWFLAVLLLGGFVLPPIVAAFRRPWSPWYWFPIAIGNGIGVLLAMAVCWIFGIV